MVDLKEGTVADGEVEIRRILGAAEAQRLDCDREAGLPSLQSGRLADAAEAATATCHGEAEIRSRQRDRAEPSPGQGLDVQ